VHLDVKKLGRIGRVGHRINGDRRSRMRGIGWEYVHVATDSIAAGEFDPTPGPWCHHCDFLRFCEPGKQEVGS
jgi:hypothetical protein